MNTAVSEFVLYVVVYNEYQYGRIFGPSGLVYNINNLFITNAVVPFLILLVDPLYLVFKYVKKNELKKGKDSLLT
jgi:hypothetical protein